MLRFALLFIVPLLVSADVDHDGPCPSPPATDPNAQEDQLTGVWYAARTNYELHKSSDRQCVEVKITKEGNSIFAETHYRDANSDDNVLRKKYEPVEGQSGRYNAYKQKADGSYEPHGWVYSIVKVHPQGVVLEYACKQSGNKHREFYRTFAKQLPVPQNVRDEMKQVYEGLGDSRPMEQYNQDNCNYKLN